MDKLLSPRQNRLLSALPDADYTRIAAQLELVSLRLGESIYESGDKIEYIYFPITSILSLLYVMKNGSSAEIAVAGYESVVGIALFMGGAAPPAERWCKAPGTAIV